MPTLDEIARFQTALGDDDVVWLQALVTDWQIVADLSFSDLVLWVPDAEAKGVWAAAQIRPTTGPTMLLEDVQGTFVPDDRVAAIDQAMSPVSRDGREIARIGHRSAQGARSRSALEIAYADASEALVAMIGRGAFPLPGRRSDLADSLRVGDGFVRTDRAGRVVYASPNALSAYRRLGHHGDLVGVDLAQVTTSLVDRRPTDRGAAAVFAADDGGELELVNVAATLAARVIPLSGQRSRTGAIVLLRDVTELRLREQELVSKEATIREIHHRVKNNLQTVAALLRLQARRSDQPEAKEALREAERRVASIALVHETLSQSFGDEVDFDDVADGLLRSVLDVSVLGSSAVRAVRIGSFGRLPGAVATPLAMVVTELVQNAVSHAFDETPGEVRVAVNRIRGRLRIRITDDGRGLPDDFDASGAGSLGLSIVRSLVESELHGELTFGPGSTGAHARGTTVTVTFDVR